MLRVTITSLDDGTSGQVPSADALYLKKSHL